MTTQAAAARYLAEHQAEYAGKTFVVHNPNNLPIEDLPVIYGFNNGGISPYRFRGVLIAEDGTILGGHTCSDEAYMLYDLGIIECGRSYHHDAFREHYPDGYRMDFVSQNDVANHDGLQAALQKHEGKSA